MYNLAVDIGTTNIKCVLFGPGAVPAAQATREHGTSYPGSSWAEQRAEEWWAGTVEAIRQVLSESGVDSASIAAVAVSGQAPTLLALDTGGKPLAPAIIWMDRRSADQCERLKREIGAERIYGITGSWPDSFYLLSKLRWFRENRPELADKTAVFLQSNGYINFMLTGERSVDAGHASLSQACDLASGAWSGELLKAAGFDSSVMPRIAESGDIIGMVTAQAAALTGLKAGTPVLAGAVDAIGGALEAGILGEGASAEMSGTSSTLLMASEQARPSPKLTYIKGAAPRHHISAGPMSSTGAALKWLRDLAYGGTGAGAKAYDLINAEAAMAGEVAAGAGGPSGIIFLPYMAGERAPIWDSDARGAFIGLTLDKNRADLARAVMEGAAFALRDNVEAAEAAGCAIGRLRVVGGHSASETWLKIKASILDREIEAMGDSLGAPGGLAYLLAARTGEFGSLAEAVARCLKPGKVTEPVKDWVGRYDELFQRYKAVYAHLKEDFAALAAIGWR
jgi:xylulokinase